ncbi:T9SS type A sorting domain-containing protein [bacterium]|nr:T9SS type A sorting domain-containing protein [bacterium]
MTNFKKPRNGSKSICARRKWTFSFKGGILSASLLLAVAGLPPAVSPGNALLFRGRGRVEIPLHAGIRFGERFTVELRFLALDEGPSSLANDWTPNLFGKPQGWLLDLGRIGPLGEPMSGSESRDPVDADPASGAVRFAGAFSREDGVNGWGGTFMESAVNSGDWTHLALVFNGVSREVLFYLNGSEIHRGWSGAFLEDIHAPEKILRLGGMHPLVDSTLGFAGAIDECRIWNRIRTHEQIRKFMAGILPENTMTVPDSGLLACFCFDSLENLGVGNDGLADDCRDLSFWANHGDIQGEAILVDSLLSPVTSGIRNPGSPDPGLVFQHFPNPFNSTSDIRIHLPRSGFCTLVIYDVKGVLIRTLFSGILNSGENRISWDAGELPSGVYLASLTTPWSHGMRRCLILR